MLARAVPGAAVFVCDQRALAGAGARRHFRATVHVLDDGFQHRALARDVDIVVIAPEDLSDRPLPFGRLRSLGALGAADAVVFDDGQGRGSEVSGTEPVLQRFAVGGEPWLGGSMGDVRPLESHRPWLAPERGPVVALAGIAGPIGSSAGSGITAGRWRVTSHSATTMPIRLKTSRSLPRTSSPPARRAFSPPRKTRNACFPGGHSRCMTACRLP